MSSKAAREVPTLVVNQWLPGWDKIDFNPGEHRRKPDKHFYLFSLPAGELRSLSGIVRREAKNAAPRTDDLGIQRQHDEERSDEIGRFVEFGFPWSTLSEAKRATAEFNDLRKPGWLPTAVVLSILPKGVQRNGVFVAEEDLVTITKSGNHQQLRLPYEKWERSWRPAKLPPFEIIDGQHRLWAFGDSPQLDTFELPVVAFMGLDISWQAYLFWTINIKPKRINPSLAFDLYPLLRNEEWLDRAEGHQIYRDTRAQELTEILWSYPESPWYDRINMLGERQNPWVTQSAWIKSLTASFIRPWDRRAGNTGGLFGGRSRIPGEVLGWSRAQQAAFLIFTWNCLKESVQAFDSGWARNLRSLSKASPEATSFGPVGNEDRAFYGPYSLISSDQGVRGYHQVINDVCYLRASSLHLNQWRPSEAAYSDPVRGVQEALATLPTQGFAEFLKALNKSLASFDWRTSATPNLDEPIRRAKLVFRGSSGYKELRMQLLEHVARGDGDLADTAKRLIAAA
jgi:hypothetical protein